VNREPEVGRQVATDLMPRIASVVAPHHVPVLLHEQDVGSRRMQGQAMHAMADLGRRIGNHPLGPQTPVLRRPGLPRVVSAEHPGGRDGDEHPVQIARVREHRVQTHPPSPRLPLGTRLVATQAGELLPALPAIGRAEQRRVLDPGVQRVRVARRRLEMPHPLELPRVRCAVVPQVGARLTVVDKLVADRVPRLSPVVRPLDDLPVPVGPLRRIHPIRIGRRSLDVVDLPAPEMGSVDLPLAACGVRRNDERSLLCPDQNSHPAHVALLPQASLLSCCRTRRRNPPTSSRLLSPDF
jgi:hypothetical protein